MQIPTLRCFCPSVLVFGILLLVPAPAPAQSQEPAGSAAKAAPLSTLDRLVNTLFATRGFEQAQSSPDGKTIAILVTENATRAAGPLVAETAQTGEIKEAVSEQRLALVDAATGMLRQISPPDMYVYE